MLENLYILLCLVNYGGGGGIYEFHYVKLIMMENKWISLCLVNYGGKSIDFTMLS